MWRSKAFHLYKRTFHNNNNKNQTIPFPILSTSFNHFVQRHSIHYITNYNLQPLSNDVNVIRCYLILYIGNPIQHEVKNIGEMYISLEDTRKLIFFPKVLGVECDAFRKTPPDLLLMFK